MEEPVARRTRSHIPQYESAPPASTSFQLPLGGTFHVYPNLISPQRQEELTAELLDNPTFFRQYRIQGGPEPRAHFLLHDQATNDDFDTSIQPGYKYGTITMKARPLSLLPKLETLAHEMQETCQVPSWNVGINPVFYRDNRDHFGLHADNDQGEDKILTILIKSPPVSRKVVIQTCSSQNDKDSKSKKKHEGDEQYQLSMGAGDAYDMDGVMQQHYVHGVPSSSGNQDSRIALVLRNGNYIKYVKDSGSELDNLDPRIVIPRAFGRMNGLVEGDSYSRARIRELGANCSPQGGISGNKTDGCEQSTVYTSVDAHAWQPPPVRQCSSASAVRQARLSCRPSPYVKRHEQSDMLRIKGVQSAVSCESLNVPETMLDALQSSASCDSMQSNIQREAQLRRFIIVSPPPAMEQSNSVPLHYPIQHPWERQSPVFKTAKFQVASARAATSIGPPAVSSNTPVQYEAPPGWLN